MPSSQSRRVFGSWMGVGMRLGALAACLLVDVSIVVVLQVRNRLDHTFNAFLFLALTRWTLGVCGGVIAYVAGSRTERRQAKPNIKGRGLSSSATDLQPHQHAPLLSIGTKPSNQEFADEANEEVRNLREFYCSQRRDHVLRDRILDLLFLVATLSAAGTGIGALRRSYPDDYTERNMQICFLGILVFLIHAELSCLRDAIWCATDAEPVLIPEVHQHPVYFVPIMKASRKCQFCQQVLKDAYRCPMCWNYCCVSCVRSRLIRARIAAARGENAVVGEGQLMGDRGPKDMPTEFKLWALLRQTLGLMSEFRGTVLLTFLSVTLMQVATILRPHFQGKVLDDISLHLQDAFLFDIVAYAGVSVAAGFFGGCQNFGVEVIARKLSFTLKERLFARFMHQDVAFFDAMTTGTLMSRLSNDVQMMLYPSRSIIRTVLGNMLLLMGGLVMSFLTSWQLTILTFSTISPIADLTARYAKWAAGLNARIAAANAEANTVAQEALSNSRAVKTHGMEEEEISRYSDHLLEALRSGMRDALGSAATFTLTNYIEFFTGILVLWYGGRLVFDSNGTELSLGRLVTFMLYWNQMQSGWKEISNLLNDFTRAAGASQNVLAMLEVMPDMIPNDCTPAPGADFEWSVSIENVHFFYWMRPSQIVIQGLSLHIPVGSTCALVGRSGGGKSTLIHLLMRFYDPRSARDARTPTESNGCLEAHGLICIGGVDLKRLPLAWYRKHIGLVAQDTPLFNLTIEENIAYGMAPGSFDDSDMKAACEAAFASEFVDKLEEGLQSRVGERGVRLSGGQRQRIALARCFIRKPHILLLDEATSALDAASEAAVQRGIDQLLARAVRKVTVVLVAHRLSTVVGADKIAVVHEGKIIEEGNHAELLKLHGVYASLVEAQLRRTANEIEEQQIFDKVK